jgi:hypothetical protein
MMVQGYPQVFLLSPPRFTRRAQQKDLWIALLTVSNMTLAKLYGKGNPT